MSTLTPEVIAEPDAYDTGLLSDYGGGNVDWWWDYIRAELARAHEHYAAQWPTASPEAAPVAVTEGELTGRALFDLFQREITRASAMPQEVQWTDCDAEGQAVYERVAAAIATPRPTPTAGEEEQ